MGYRTHGRLPLAVLRLSSPNVSLYMGLKRGPGARFKLRRRVSRRKKTTLVMTNKGLFKHIFGIEGKVYHNVLIYIGKTPDRISC